MTRSPLQLQHKAVGKTQGGPRAEQIERRGHDVRILQYQVFVIQQHFDGGDKVGRAPWVHCGQDPCRLSERENRYPGALLHEDIGGSRAWRASSRVMRRTRTLVSAAGIALPGASPDPLFHVIDSSRFRHPLREQRPMDVLGHKPSRAPHDDLIAVLVPFQDRTRADAIAWVSQVICCLIQTDPRSRRAKRNNDISDNIAKAYGFPAFTNAPLYRLGLGSHWAA